MTATVLRSGFVSTVQDLGRAGHRPSGVSPGGALDAHALKVANLLVGNEISAAGIELTLGNVQIRFGDERAVAWAGGEFKVRVGETEVPPGRVALLRRGEELCLAAPEHGGRAWLAISGGVDVPPTLGSRSTDLRGGFGGFKGRALRDGDQLVLGPRSAAAGLIQSQIADGRIASWGATAEWVSTTPPHPFLRIVRGTQWSDFDETADTSLLHGSFAVAADSDRMGVRFEGAGMSRLTSDELISEAVAPGTIQVPPSGRPILLLGDCQTIGGYPKIAHVITVDLPFAAQLQPGALVRFAEVSLGEAHRLLVERERALERFRIGLELQANGVPRRRAQP